MTEERSDTRSSYNFSLSHGSEKHSLTENQKILLYMDNVFNKISQFPSTSFIIVSKKLNCFKTNMDTAEKAKYTYASVSSFSDKVESLMSKLLPNEPIESIRIKGTKKSEIFVTFDEHLEIVVVDKSHGQ